MVSIASYYDQLVDRFGHNPRAVDAGSWKSLRKRYGVLSAAIPVGCRSVLEVGCGLGDLGQYLHREFPLMRYTGIDVSPRMIEEGHRVHPRLDLRQGNVLDRSLTGSYDVVLAQGIFYRLGPEAERKSFQLIKKMVSKARRVVAFCAISTWADRRNSSEFYVDPAWLVTQCRRLTRFLALRHDYHPGDVAVYLYKRKEDLPWKNG
jgi:SAM-dependent methyltransferase